MSHVYLSTACLHLFHGYCKAPKVSRDGTWAIAGVSYSAERNEPKKPAQCKWCRARCVCPCHKNGETEESL